MKKNVRTILDPLVSVIIPVYNASVTLTKTLDSLKEQTYNRIELIFVNDGSSDNSLSILHKYARKTEEHKNIRVKIISHDVNKGVAEARNSGIANAEGKYLYYVDADDWLDHDAIQCMVDKAEEDNLDIVGINWWLSFDRGERKMNQVAFNSSNDAIYKIMRGTLRWNLWLFLVKRELYTLNNIKFISGMDMGEDLMVMLKLFAVADRVTYLDKPAYHYGQMNEASLTKVYSDAHYCQVNQNIQEASDFLKSSSYANRLHEDLHFLKLNIKLPLLVSGQKAAFRRWREWFPEVNQYAVKNNSQPFRTRLIQWLAVHQYDWALRLYYFIVMKFLYQILYR